MPPEPSRPETPIYDGLANMEPQCETCYTLQQALAAGKAENDTLREEVLGLKKEIEVGREKLEKYKRDFAELVG